MIDDIRRNLTELAALTRTGWRRLPDSAKAIIRTMLAVIGAALATLGFDVLADVRLWAEGASIDWSAEIWASVRTTVATSAAATQAALVALITWLMNRGARGARYG